MSLNKSMEKMKFDHRLLDLNLRLGLITQDEYDQYVTALPDSSENSEKIDIEEAKLETEFASH
jgi:hypothetical protein